MTYERREAGHWVFRMQSRERDLLASVLRFREHFPRQPRSMSRESVATPRWTDAEAELNEALAAHRTGLAGFADRLLDDPDHCRSVGEGHELRVDLDEAHRLLQALNEVRLGAWEKLGCPDFEADEHPKPESDSMICLWALQLTGAFQSALLEALADKDAG